MNSRRQRTPGRWSATALLLLLTWGCHAPSAADPDPSTAPEPDVDPYFTESTDITRRHGPMSITREVFQDRDGRIWCATWEGIIGFDGETFTNHTNRDALRRYRAFTILQDRSGVLWFGTVGVGIYRYDGTEFTNFSTVDGLVNDRVGALTEMSDGTLWVGTENGISRYDGTTFRNLTAEDGLLDTDVNRIVEARNGDIWIATRGRSFRYDGETFTPLVTADGLEFRNVRCILEDRQGRIWLGGNDGLWRFDGRTYTRLDPRFVGYLYEARDGRIWVSAQDGEAGYDMALFVVAPDASPLDAEPLEMVVDIPGQVFGIVEDTEGSIWFGTERGVVRYDGAKFRTFDG